MCIRLTFVSALHALLFSSNCCLQYLKSISSSCCTHQIVRASLHRFVGVGGGHGLHFLGLPRAQVVQRKPGLPPGLPGLVYLMREIVRRHIHTVTGNQ